MASRSMGGGHSGQVLHSNLPPTRQDSLSPPLVGPRHYGLPSLRRRSIGNNHGLGRTPRPHCQPARAFLHVATPRGDTIGNEHADLLLGGTESPARSLAAAYGTHVGDGKPQRQWSTAFGYGHSCPLNGRYLWCAYREWRFPNGAGLVARRVESRAQSVAASYEALAGEWPPATPEIRCLKGPGIVPSRWLLPLERL